VEGVMKRRAPLLLGTILALVAILLVSRRVHEPELTFESPQEENRSVPLEVVRDDELREWLEIYEWIDTMHEAGRLAWGAQLEDALNLYEQALTVATTEEQKAEALLYMAEAYEPLSRSQAVEAYKKILEECPTSKLLPRVCSRLGEVHTSITLTPRARGHEEWQRVHTEEMVPSKAIPYYEKGVAAGPPLNRYVLDCRSGLANLYNDTDRKEEALNILYQLASLDEDQVQEPEFVGPYTEKIQTREERLQSAREHIQMVRRSAKQHLAEWSYVPGDPAASIANLQALMERYPEDSEITPVAEEQIAAMEELIRTGASKEP